MRLRTTYALLLACMLLPYTLDAQPGNNSRPFTQGPEIGAELPEITGFDAEGNEFPLSNLKGQYSVVVFGCLT